MSQPMLRGRERSYSKHGSSGKDGSAASVQSDNASVAEPCSSQSYDRPRSQANTASRMMHPPQYDLQLSQSRNGGSVFDKKVLSQHPGQGKAAQRFRSSDSNVDTPDLMRSKVSVARQTHSQYDPQNVVGMASQQSTSRATVQDRTLKRKKSSHVSERELVIKKPRISPETDRIPDTPGSRSHASKSSVADSRSKMHNNSLYAHGTSSSSHPKAPNKSSSNQSRTSSQVASPRDNYPSRQRQLPQAHLQDSSTRLTRSKSMRTNPVWKDTVSA